MAQTPYNPQEALAPLMQRFGRHLDADRDEGLDRMAAALREELHVDDSNARKLLQSLETSGLIAYERPAPLTTDTQPLTTAEGETVVTKAQPAGIGRTATSERGAWRIGPIG